MPLSMAKLAIPDGANEPLSILRHTFGYPAFRGLQAEVIEQVRPLASRFDAAVPRNLPLHWNRQNFTRRQVIAGALGATAGAACPWARAATPFAPPPLEYPSLDLPGPGGLTAQRRSLDGGVGGGSSDRSGALERLFSGHETTKNEGCG